MKHLSLYAWLDITFASSLTWLWKSFWRTIEYSVRTLTTVFANLFIYLFQISGSWHSSFWSTSKHWVSWVNTSTTEFEKFACSVFFWNYDENKKYCQVWKKPYLRVKSILSCFYFILIFNLLGLFYPWRMHFSRTLSLHHHSRLTIA